MRLHLVDNTKLLHYSLCAGLRSGLPLQRGRNQHVLRVGEPQARGHPLLPGQEFPLKVHW